MKRKGIIIIDQRIYNYMLDQAKLNPNLECGGFLYGRISPIKDGVVHVYVSGIYSEYYNADANCFKFSPMYISNAQRWGEEHDLSIIGIFHSHGQYNSCPSLQDFIAYNELFPLNGVSVILSPAYESVHADLILEDAIINGNDIYSKCGDNFYLLPNIDEADHKVITRHKC